MTSCLLCCACGHLVLPTTAARNDGLCISCKGSYRQNIEDGKRFYTGRWRYLASPQALYWSALVNRVYGGREGFAGLSSAGRSYYTLSMLSDKVHNGGFGRYFGNPSSGQHQTARTGLRELEVGSVLALLKWAIALPFGNGPMSVSQAGRQLRTSTWANGPDCDCETALNALDTRFYALADAPDERLLIHARRHTLFVPDKPDETWIGCPKDLARTTAAGCLRRRSGIARWPPRRIGPAALHRR